MNGWLRLESAPQQSNKRLELAPPVVVELHL
jgi:hypothetical protein